MRPSPIIFGGGLFFILHKFHLSEVIIKANIVLFRFYPDFT